MQGQSLTQTIALTPVGRAILDQELQSLRAEQLPTLARRLTDAREDSASRHEDAGLLELQEELLRAERRAVELERLLADAREIAPTVDGVVALGSRSQKRALA